MARNMSFMLTTDQIRDRSKTVTRRNGWLFLKVGDKVRAVEKCQGLKKGEKVRPLAMIEIIDIKMEPLDQITQRECVKEGFPGMTPGEFIDMYMGANKMRNDHDLVTRIEFKYLKEVGE